MGGLLSVLYSKCEAEQYEYISDMGDLQVQQNLTAAADFNFVCEDCE